MNNLTKLLLTQTLNIAKPTTLNNTNTNKTSYNTYNSYFGVTKSLNTDAKNNNYTIVNNNNLTSNFVHKHLVNLPTNNITKQANNSVNTKTLQNVTNNINNIQTQTKSVTKHKPTSSISNNKLTITKTTPNVVTTKNYYKYNTNDLFYLFFLLIPICMLAFIAYKYSNSNTPVQNNTQQPQSTNQNNSSESSSDSSSESSKENNETRL